MPPDENDPNLVNPTNPRSTPSSQEISQEGTPLGCANCGARDHSYVSCPQLKTGGAIPFDPCDECGRVRYHAAFCSRPRAGYARDKLDPGADIDTPSLDNPTVLETVTVAFLRQSARLELLCSEFSGFSQFSADARRRGLIEQVRVWSWESSRDVVLALADPGPPELPQPQQQALPFDCARFHVPEWLEQQLREHYRDNPCPHCGGPHETASKSFCNRCRFEHEAERRTDVCSAAKELLLRVLGAGSWPMDLRAETRALAEALQATGDWPMEQRS